MRRIAVNIGLLIGSVFFVLCVLEVIARFLVTVPNHIIRDPFVGRKLRPNVDVVSKGPLWEGHSHINSHGWNSPEVTERKPEGITRIVHIGDSQTEGMYVDTDQNFVSRLVQELPGTDGVNMGIGGQGTYPELLMYRHHARRYDPDITMLWFNPGNDFRDNLLVEHIVGTGGLVPNMGTPSQAWIKTVLLEHLRLPRLLYNYFYKNHVFTSVLIRLGLLSMEPEEFEEEIPLSYRTLVIDTPERAAAVAVTERLLKALKEEVDRGELIVGIIPSYIEAGPLAEKEFRSTYPSIGSTPLDVGFGARTAKRLAEEAGFAVLDLRPAFLAAYQRGEVPHIPNEGHLSLAGHELVIRETAKFLRETGRVK